MQALLSPRDSERICWNRTVNNPDGIGKNIPLDLCVGHSNNYIKQATKNLGPNITEQAVSAMQRALPMLSLTTWTTNCTKSLH